MNRSMAAKNAKVAQYGIQAGKTELAKEAYDKYKYAGFRCATSAHDRQMQYVAIMEEREIAARERAEQERIARERARTAEKAKAKAA